MQEYETGAVRDTGGKGRMDLVPWSAILRISRHMEDALSHYPERNWEKGLPMHSMVDSAFRHLAKYMDGQNDEDHLCAAATNLLMALWMEEKRPEMQDIPSRSPLLTPLLVGEDLKGFSPDEITKTQEKPKETPPKRCSHYDVIHQRCMGTREMDRCNCGGHTSKCDFYPEKRNEQNR